MRVLHYHPGTASMAPHILLEELGVPYQRVLVDRAAGEHKSPAYLKLNPNGLIPVLVDGDLVIYESAAICLHLCDMHPQADLLPPPGTQQRALAYQWLAWLTNTLQAALIVYFYPDRWAAPGDAAMAGAVQQAAASRIGALLDQLDAELADHGGDWLLRSGYSALDGYALMLCRWTRNFAAPARSRAHLGRYLQRLLARPAVQRAFANEGLARPWI